MAGVRRDLPQRTFEFSLRIVRLCQHLDQAPGVSRLLSRQVFRSGTSIGANIEEGQSGQSRADFIAKYFISLKEARETHYWLRLLKESQIVQEEKIAPLLDECNQLVAILNTCIKRAKENATPNKTNH